MNSAQNTENAKSPLAAVGAENVFVDVPPEPTFYFAQNLAIARKMNNRKALQVLSDIAKISWFKKRVFSPLYYFKYQMYEFAADRSEAMRLYRDDRDFVEINKSLNFAISGENAVDNKMQLESIVRQFGLAATETQRILLNDPMPFDRYLSTVEDGVNFFRQHAQYPLFCKPDKSSRSIGIFWADEYIQSTDSIRVRGVGDVDATELVTLMLEKFGATGFLIQNRLIQHPDLSRVAGEAIGCVRVLTLRTEGGIRPAYAVWKVPSRESLADNFWRTSNVVAAIDLDTGCISRAQIGSGIMGAEVEVHPESGVNFSEIEIPDWQNVLDLAVHAATLFAGIDIIGWDIAVTVDGPCIVEGNTNPDHGLYQLAAGQGLDGSAATRLIAELAAMARRVKKDKNKNQKKVTRGNAILVARRISTQGVSNRKL